MKKKNKKREAEKQVYMFKKKMQANKELMKTFLNKNL